MSDDPVFYHGTRRPFRPGGWLFPRSFHGDPGTSAPLNPGRKAPTDAADYVYVTTSRTVAWVYAWHAHGRGRPRVLRVDPHGLEHDPEHSPRMQAYRCSSARVLGVDLDPEISEEEARGGWVQAGH